MPPITHEVQATTGSSADVTVTAPATVQAGDLLLAHVAFDGNNMPAVTSVPVGWMLVEAQADGTTVYGGWWWKRAETGDASTSWVFTGNGNSEQWITHCVRVTGHHPTMPVNAYNWATGSSSGPYISPAVTTTVDDCLIIYSLARDGGSHSHTPPVGCVEIFDGVSAASGGTAATKTQSTAGDTGSGEFGSATVEQWIAITLAIAPEPSDDTLISMPLTIGAPVLGTPDLSGPGVSPAPVWETDVEEAAPLDRWTFSRNTTVTTAQAVSPTHSLALTPLPDESAYMRKSLPAVTDQVVIHMRARWEDVPSIDSVYLWYWQTSSGRSPGMSFEIEGGVIEAQLEPGDSYQQAGPVLVADHWYDIWIRIDLSGTTHTFEWIVDGVEQATIIRPDDTPDTFDASGFRPSIDRGGPTVYLDDIAIYNDPDAYPTTAANLTPVGIITGAPTLDSPALSQNHALVGDGITAGAPVLGTPDLSGPGMTPAPVFETDVEEAAPLDRWAFVHNTTVTTAQAVSPTHSLLFAPAGAEAYVGQVMPGVSDRVVVRFHLRFDTLPTVDKYVWYYGTDVGQVGIYYDAAVGHLEARLEMDDDYISVGPVISAGQWYEIVVKVDISSITYTLDWMVDEVAYATVECPDSTPGTFDSMYGMWLGTLLPGDGNLYIDDVAVYNDLAAYPGQAADLNAADILLGAPTLDSPALSQAHALAGDGLATAAPTLSAPAIGQSHALTADDAAALPPSLTAPALSQTHEITGDDVATGPPALAAAAVEQAHMLTAAELTSGTPVPGTPSLGAVTLTAEDVALGAPVLPSPGLAQIHVLAAASVALDAPVLGTPTLAQGHELSAQGLLLSAPMLDRPALTQRYALNTDGLLLSAPVLDTPTLSQAHALVAGGAAVLPPSLTTPALTQTHEIAGDDVATGPPLPDNPVLDQAHVLVAMPLATAAPVPGRPPLVQTHELVAVSIVTGVPVPGRSHFRVVTAVFFSARMPGMAVSAHQPRVAFDVEEEI